MPYFDANDPNLPEYIKKQSPAIRARWVVIFNSVFSTQGEEMAFIVANKWLVREEKKGNFVKRSVVTFEVDTSKGFIKRSDDGEDYITFILNSTKPHKDGKVFTSRMLQSWADSINKESIIGDIDHSEYDRLVNSNMSDEEVQKYLKSKPGIAKSVKAVFEKGKLWVKALIDKRYKKLIDSSKGVSAEAFVNWEGNVATEGDLLGFTFNVLSTPADSTAGVFV